MTRKQTTELDPEIAAIGAVNKALRGLTPDAQARVLNYVAGKLKVDLPIGQAEQASSQRRSDVPDSAAGQAAAESREGTDDELEGISPVAKKRMTRNGLQAKALARIFSLGVTTST